MYICIKLLTIFIILYKLSITWNLKSKTINRCICAYEQQSTLYRSAGLTPASYLYVFASTASLVLPKHIHVVRFTIIKTFPKVDTKRCNSIICYWLLCNNSHSSLSPYSNVDDTNCLLGSILFSYLSFYTVGNADTCTLKSDNTSCHSSSSDSSSNSTDWKELTFFFFLCGQFLLLIIHKLLKDTTVDFDDV